MGRIWRAVAARNDETGSGRRSRIDSAVMRRMDSRSWTVDDDARAKMAAAVIWWLLSLDECGERAAVEG